MNNVTCLAIDKEVADFLDKDFNERGYPIDYLSNNISNNFKYIHMDIKSEYYTKAMSAYR